MIVRYRTAHLDGILRTVVQHWDDVLGAVQVTTPDRAMNVLLNRLLLNQTSAVLASGARVAERRNHVPLSRVA